MTMLEPFWLTDAGGASPSRVDEVVHLLETRSDHPSASLILNDGIDYFRDLRHDGLIAYRAQGSRLLQIGGVIADQQSRDAILGSFSDFAARKRKRILALQLRESDLPSYRRLGFRMNEIGRSYTLDIRDYDLKGTRFMKLRNKLLQPKKVGVEVLEVGQDLPFDAKLRAQLDLVTSEWLRAKGRGVKLLRLLVGEIERVGDQRNRCFVARIGSRVIGFITYTAVYGRRPGYLHDLTRRVNDVPPGLMELINDTAIRRFKSEGVSYLHFGFTPFAGVDDQGEHHSPFITKLMRWLAVHGSALYPAQSQMQYKMKWFPQHIEPEFVGYQDGLGFRDLWAILRATGTI